MRVCVCALQLRVIPPVRTSPQSCSCSCCHLSTLCWPAGSWPILPADTPPPCPSPHSSGCCCRPYPPSYLPTLLWQKQETAYKQIKLCKVPFIQNSFQLSGFSCRKRRYSEHRLQVTGGLGAAIRHYCQVSSLITEVLQIIPCKFISHSDLSNIHNIFR